MNSETGYRIVVIILFLSLAVIGFSHRIRANKSGDRISRRKEGVPLMILLRLFGFAMWFGLLLYMLNPRWMAWAALPLPGWLRWLGAPLAVIAVPLIFWMFHSLGNNVTDTVVVRREHNLVTHGPYRYIRHPMYLFSFLFISGLCLLAANWFIWSAGLVALLMLVIRTPIEEAELLNRFGDEYRAYMARTGRFLPRFH